MLTNYYEICFLLLRANIFSANQEEETSKTFQLVIKRVSTLLATTATHVSSVNRTNLHSFVERHTLI